MLEEFQLASQSVQGNRPSRINTEIASISTGMFVSHLLRPTSCLFILLLALMPIEVFAEQQGAGHSDPIAPVILGVTSILFFAIVGRITARRIGQPPVLGELLMGVLLGNLGYYFGSELITLLRQGPALFDAIQLTLQGYDLSGAVHSILDPEVAQSVTGILEGSNGMALIQVAQTVDVFSRYGVIFLLFLVGLDTSLEELHGVGAESLRVAVIGSLLPMFLGIGVLWWLAPGLPLNTDIFIGATLAATSISITARVLKDLDRGDSREAHIILGAAVMDDVLGLLLLAVVTGIFVSGGVAWTEITYVVVLAGLYLAGAVVLGPHLVRLMVRILCRLDLVEAKMFTSYLFVMVLAWMANVAGLATIIGAFTAGLILQETYFSRCKKRPGHTYTIKDLIMPLEVILVPIFFVLMGIQVKLEAFLDMQVLVVATGLITVAVIGKLVSGMGASRGTNRWAIGIGMMPRGEVGLIFAAIGKSLGVMDDALFSAVILMVIFTTVIAPPLFKLTLGAQANPSQETG